MQIKINKFSKILIFFMVLVFALILGAGKTAFADNIVNAKNGRPPQNIQHQSAIVTAYSFYAKALHMEWNYDTYLPAGYNPKSKRKYPVLYMLNGRFDNNNSQWLRTDSEKMLDSAEQKTGQPMIVVFVDGFNSRYLNSNKGLQMETAIIHNLMPRVEKDYNVSKKASQTAIGGQSMGGYGASRLALKYPNKFSKVMAVSPGVIYKLSSSFKKTVPVYDNKKGKFSQKKYNAYFPTKYIDKKSKKVKFYVETTNTDTNVRVSNVRRFVKTLKREGISTNYVEDHGGNHGWDYWNKSFPKAYLWTDQQFKKANPKNLNPASHPKFEVGSSVTLLSSHMPGMKGAKAKVVGVYNTKLYEINYKPTNDMAEVKHHKWIVGPEIKGAKTNYKPGDQIKISANHMKGMSGASGKIVKVHSGPAYMVNYKPTNGMSEVKNHKWIAQSEIK